MSISVVATLYRTVKRKHRDGKNKAVREVLGGEMMSGTTDHVA